MTPVVVILMDFISVLQSYEGVRQETVNKQLPSLVVANKFTI
jgi:hypothetical protein